MNSRGNYAELLEHGDNDFEVVADNRRLPWAEVITFSEAIDGGADLRPGENHPLAAAQGIFNGLLLSVPLWAGIGVVIYYLL